MRREKSSPVACVPNMKSPPQLNASMRAQRQTERALDPRMSAVRAAGNDTVAVPSRSRPPLLRPSWPVVAVAPERAPARAEFPDAATAVPSSRG